MTGVPRRPLPRRAGAGVAFAATWAVLATVIVVPSVTGLVSLQSALEGLVGPTSSPSGTAAGDPGAAESALPSQAASTPAATGSPSATSTAATPSGNGWTADGSGQSTGQSDSGQSSTGGSSSKRSTTSQGSGQASGGSGQSGPWPGQANSPAQTLTSHQWVLVLDSLKPSEYSYDQAVAAAENIDSSVIVVDSTATPGLRDGFWALVVTGYSSESDARAGCSSFGRAIGGQCYPREIS